MLDSEVALNALNQPSKFRARNWVEINDDIRGAYSSNKQIGFKTTILRSSLCDYRDAYILIKINNTQIDNAEYIDIVMNMYNLIEYSDNYFKNI